MGVQVITGILINFINIKQVISINLFKNTTNKTVTIVINKLIVNNLEK